MKKLITFLFLFSLILNNNAQDFRVSNLPSSARPTAGDLFYFIDGSTSKKLLYDSLAMTISDSIDNARSDLADTSVAIRADISAANAGWTKAGNHIYATSTGDSVGIGTTSPTSRLDVSGVIKALSANLDDGFSNIIVGSGSGTALTSSGTKNILIGINVGQALITQDETVLIGYESGKALTGTGNVFVGGNTGVVATSANDNCLFGDRVGIALSTGDRNNIFGDDAGEAITSGSDNCIFGTHGALPATGNTQMTYFGNYTGAGVASSYNTGVGYDALYDAGQYNTAIGHSAGGSRSVGLTGTENTFLGEGTGYSIADVDNSTAVGSDVILDRDNEVILGNNAEVRLDGHTNDQWFLVKSLVKTVGANGSGADYTFSTDADSDAEELEITDIIPAFARILDVAAITTTGWTNAISVDVGIDANKSRFCTGQNLQAANAIGQSLPGEQFEVSINAAAYSVFVTVNPTGNWVDMASGQMSILITYIDNAVIK